YAPGYPGAQCSASPRGNRRLVRDLSIRRVWTNREPAGLPQPSRATRNLGGCGTPRINMLAWRERRRFTQCADSSGDARFSGGKLVLIRKDSFERDRDPEVHELRGAEQSPPRMEPACSERRLRPSSKLRLAFHAVGSQSCEPRALGARRARR